GLVQLDRFANRPDRHGGRADVVGDFLQFRIVARSVVERDAVGYERALAGQEGPAVVDVLPGLGAGDEGGIERLSVLDGRPRLRAVDRHIALFIDHLAAMAPEQPVGIVVAVADSLAVREAGRGPVGLKRLTELQEAVGVIGEFREAGGLYVAGAVADGIADSAQRQGNELIAAAPVTFDAWVPAAVGFSEGGGEVGHIDQLIRILMRVIEPAHHEVRAGADVGSYRGFRAYVLPAFLLDAHGHAGRFGKGLGVGVP